MPPQFENVWVIPTVCGEAIRSKMDIAQEDEKKMNLKPSSRMELIPATIDKSELKTVRFRISDLPDMKRRETEISNVCGFVEGYTAIWEAHPAWRSVRSTLGRFREAYSLRGGNLLFLRGKLIFKGATCREGVYSTVRRVIGDPETPVLRAYLIISTAYMRRNVFVHTGCLLEEMLSRFAWCRVMYRHEELSNAIVFYIRSWHQFQLPANRVKPNVGTVTVSRRGVVNVRLGWHDGVEWAGNEEWILLVDSIRDFLLDLC